MNFICKYLRADRIQYCLSTHIFLEFYRTLKLVVLNFQKNKFKTRLYIAWTTLSLVKDHKSNLI
jgi:hypothetical protein